MGKNVKVKSHKGIKVAISLFATLLFLTSLAGIVWYFMFYAKPENKEMHGKFEIQTVVDGNGTPVNNLVIAPEEGYQIASIEIEGVSKPVTAKNGEIQTMTLPSHLTIKDVIVRFEPRKFKLYYEGNYLDASNKVIAYKSPIGALEVPKKLGFAFDGWFYDNETFQRQASSSDIVNALEDIHVYPKWKEITYSIVFVKGYHTESGIMEPLNNIKFSDRIKLPKNVFTNKNAIFDGWRRVGSLSGSPEFRDEEEIYGLAEGDKQIIELTPVWRAIEHDVQINIASGRGGMINVPSFQKIKHNRALSFLITPLKGYKINKIVDNGKTLDLALFDGEDRIYKIDHVTEKHTIDIYFNKMVTDDIYFSFQGYAPKANMEGTGNEIDENGNVVYIPCDDEKLVEFYEVKSLKQLTSEMTSIKIPETYLDKPVKRIAGDLRPQTSSDSFTYIEELMLPKTITYIGNNAFSNFYNLKLLVLPELDKDNLNPEELVIGDAAFSGLRYIKEITIPRNVIKIPANAFMNCAELTKVTIEDESSLTVVADFAFNGCSKLEKINLPEFVTTIGNSAFQSCEKLNQVSVAYNKNGTPTKVNYLPRHLVTLGDNAFYNCSSLPNLVFNINYISNEDNMESLTSIGKDALHGCKSLTGIINIPNSVTDIKDFAFFGCENCDFVIGNESRLQTLGQGAFEQCAKMKSFRVPDNIKILNDRVFYGCKSLKELNLNNVEDLNGYEIFASCESLISIDLSKITRFKNDAVSAIGLFQDCLNLKSVTYGDNIKILPSMFKNCKSLTTFTNSTDTSINNQFILIPNNVTTISDYAFEGCSSIVNVKVQEGSQLDTIGAYAFLNCSSLKDIEIPATVKNINGRAFKDCVALENVYIYDIEKWASILFEMCNDDNNSKDKINNAQPLNYAKNLVLNGEILTSINLQTITIVNSFAFQNFKNLTDVVLGDSITVIGDYAFDGCSNLTNVNGTPELGNILFPASVSEIKDSAFSGCDKIKSVTLNNTVLTVGNGVFSNCKMLESIIVEEGNINIVKDISNVALIKKVATDDQVLVTYPSKSVLTEYTVQEGVTIIGERAFSNVRNLETINLPMSLTTISPYAFEDCTSLKYVNFAKDPLNGSGLTVIGDYAFKGCKAITSFNVTKNVNNIGNSAFIDCPSLKSFVIDEGNIKFSTDATGSMLLQKQTNAEEKSLISFAKGFNTVSAEHGGKVTIVITKDITQLKDNAFSNSLIEKVIFDAGGMIDNESKMGKSTFENCLNLEIVEFRNGAKVVISESMFKGCENLKLLDISPNINFEGYSSDNVFAHAFEGCKSLNSFTILPGMIIQKSISDGISHKQIDSDVFKDCISLKYVKILSQASATDYDVFRKIQLESVYVDREEPLASQENYDAFRNAFGHVKELWLKRTMDFKNIGKFIDKDYERTVTIRGNYILFQSKTK